MRTRGRLGRTMETRPIKLSIACRVARAGGVKARTYRGNPCDPNWWWKSPTTICKEAASVIQHSFADGERTRSPARVLCRLRPLPFNQATTPMRHRGPPMQPVHGPDSGPLGQLSRAVWSLAAACSQRPAILLTLQEISALVRMIHIDFVN